MTMAKKRKKKEKEGRRVGGEVRQVKRKRHTGKGGTGRRVRERGRARVRVPGLHSGGKVMDVVGSSVSICQCVKGDAP